MKTQFELLRINIQDIDFEDKRFKITNDKNDCEFDRSIKFFGVLNPPLLLNKNNGYCLISGFRRIDALKRYGVHQIEARVTDTQDLLHCAQIAILDNACHRQLMIAEQIRSVKLLSTFFLDHENSDVFFETVCSSLMVPNNRAFIKKIMSASHLSGNLMDLVINERISLEVAIDLASFDIETQEKFRPFFSEFKASLSKQKEFILLVREIAARENLPVKAILDDVSLLIPSYTDNKDKNSIFSIVRNYLQQRRFPEISNVIEHHNRLVSRLKFPDSVKFIIPESFEGSTYHIQFMFKTLTELKQINKKIEQICSQPEMEMILTRDYNME